jgi:hypothetical protein
VEKEYPEIINTEGAVFAGQSRIYARDIYMREINSPYSYNLWSFDMAPDRHGPKEESDLWVDAGRLWCCVTKVEHLKVFLEMVKQPPVIESDESHALNMSTWEMGQEPVTGKEYAEFVRENAPVWREAWRKVIGENAVIRTDSRWDGMVRHLGYESVSVQSYVRETLSRAISTDRELIKISQERLREVEIIRMRNSNPFPHSPQSGQANREESVSVFAAIRNLCCRDSSGQRQG